MRNESVTESASGVSRGALWLPSAVIISTLAVFVAVVALLTGQLRERLKSAILREDGEVLAAAIEATESESEGSAQDTVVRVLEASDFRLRDVFAFRIFDLSGKYIVGFPKNLSPEDLFADDAETVAAGEVIGRFDPAMDLGSQFVEGSEKYTGPVLRATVPILTNGKVTGIAQFLLNGERTQVKLADTDLWRYTMWFSVVGGTLIAGGLIWAFYRLNRANALLAARSADLLRANQELTMAAKTSALGAVTAHLIHGLKNPLFGLHAFVSGQTGERGEKQWQAAVDTTRRMQAMIADVVRIMREEEGERYEVSIGDVVQILDDKICPGAKEAQIVFTVKNNAHGLLPNRECNLIVLALTNLIQNAIQASKPGKAVAVHIYDAQNCVCFDVADDAGGLPTRALKNLFLPTLSSKAGGTGLGLAISKQLANHMGGQLDLVSTGEKGTTFRLSLPRSIFITAGQGTEKLAPATALS